MEERSGGLYLSVPVATRLNRTQLFPAWGNTFLLPTIVRSGGDRQDSVPQIVRVEDSPTCIHVARGQWEPPDGDLLSEPAIVAGLAEATLSPNPLVPWRDRLADDGRVRDAIEVTFPADFHDFNRRIDASAGFPRSIPARERVRETDTGRANFQLPKALSARFEAGGEADVLCLVTPALDRPVQHHRRRPRRPPARYRGVADDPDDESRGSHPPRHRRGRRRALTTVAGDGAVRSLGGLQVIAYPLPPGTCADYAPELNARLPLWHHDAQSKTPAAKSLPVRATAGGPRGGDG